MAPQSIRDEDELERLAGLQLRDSLVRGMGVSEQLKAVLEYDAAAITYNTREPLIISRGSSAVSKAILYSNHSYPHDSGIEDSVSGVSLPPDHDSSYVPESSHSLLGSTLLNSLPGSNYFQPDQNSKLSYSGLLKRHYRQSIHAAHHSSSTPTKSLTAAYNRPSCAFGNR